MVDFWRRKILQSLAGSFAYRWWNTTGHAGPQVTTDDWQSSDSERVFPQGVASGDPRPDGVLLWTRVEAQGEVEVEVEVSRNEDFTDIVRQAKAIATEQTDHTVRFRIDALSPRQRYWYRFLSMGVRSAVGRTQTTPADGDNAPLRLAFASCQDYQGRWYHAWRALAERADEIDVVLFLGDYIYEYERFPLLQEPLPGRQITMPDGLVVDKRNGVIAAKSLEDYRNIYRVIRTDPDLRRIHQLCPFIILWDDHEHANDAWQDHATDFNDLRGLEKDTERRKSATRAWHEHLPVDVPFDPERPFPDDILTYRSFRWGRLAELWLTDQRYYRDDHLIPEGAIVPEVGKVLPNTLLGARTMCVKEPFEVLEAQEPPTMLGTLQKQWLLDSMAQSQTTWKVWASALMVSPFVLDLRGFEGLSPAMRKEYYFKTDQWDGFCSERREILEALQKVDNLVVLSGDLHGFYASQLKADFDVPDSPSIGTEFTVAGISSISLAEQLEAIVKSQPIVAVTGFGMLPPRLDETLLASSPHFRHADSRGYGVAIAHFSETALEVEFLNIDGIRQPQWNGKVIHTKFRVRAGHNEIETIS